MSPLPASANKSPIRPRLLDTLRSLKSEIGKDLNCVKPGVVQSFDAVRGTATVQVSFQRTMEDGSIVSYKPLLDCPVFTLQGGGAHARFPVAEGDECLLVFADRSIDSWFEVGGQAPPPNPRAHDLSDGFALVGLNSLANPLLSALGPGEGGLADALAKVAVLGGRVNISSAGGTISLLVILTGLVAAVKAITTVNSDATTGQLDAASKAAINAFIAPLEALLY